jgi:hypothetical protein
MKNLVAILFLFIGAVSLSAQTLTPETLVKLARVGDPRISLMEKRSSIMYEPLTSLRIKGKATFS